MDETDVFFDSPRFDTDVNTYGAFYVYVVADGYDGLNKDIWFARSNNQGASFESPYRIAELLVSDRSYHSPDISYGYGGHLHVTWIFSPTPHDFDDSLRYRRASSFANGGLADWDYWQTMTSTNDGFDDRHPVIHAGQASNDVVLLYKRLDYTTGVYEDARVFVSDDTGVTFGSPVLIPDDMGMLGDIAEDVDTGTWYVMVLAYTDYAIWTANVADLTSWAGPQCFNDEWGSSYWWYRPDIALDPTRNNRPAVVWNKAFTGIDELNDPVALEDLAEILGEQWTSAATPDRVGRTSHTREYYGFVWNTDVVNMVNGVRVHPDPDDDVDREPAYATFVTHDGNLDFTLIGFHATWGHVVEDRRREIRWMPEVWQGVDSVDPFDDDLILGGDFNRNVGDVAFLPLLALSDGMICTNADGDRTKIDSANTYDQIYIDTAVTREWTGEYYVGDFDEAMFAGDVEAANRAVSDHRPVWITLWIPGEDDD